jgi:hypothetical protein
VTIEVTAVVALISIAKVITVATKVAVEIRGAVAVVMGVFPLLTKILLVRFARNMGTPPVSAGGSMRIVIIVMMIPTFSVVHMEWIQIGIWTLGLQIT